eukprot:10461726-Ditylum_brightwellii.AAC.1
MQYGYPASGKLLEYTMHLCPIPPPKSLHVTPLLHTIVLATSEGGQLRFLSPLQHPTSDVRDKLKSLVIKLQEAHGKEELLLFIEK